MAWWYELRGAENRLVEMRRGFATEKEAQAAERAKRTIRSCVHPMQTEDLTFLTGATKNPKQNLKLPTDWRARVLDPTFDHQTDQVSCGKQSETENSTRQIEIMTDAMLGTPMHPLEQAECFANMRKHNDYETRCAD
jgi:hypothetical protein